MVSLTINGQNLEISEGSSVLQAAERLGIIIPTLCYHKDLSPYGGCRLCVVEVQGNRLPATACTLPVSPGMVVQTESPALTMARRSTLTMLLRNFYDAGYKRSQETYDLDSDTQFAYWVKAYGIDLKSAMAKRPHSPIDTDPNPYIWVDPNKCILCTRCVRACAQVQGRFVWNEAFRGYRARIVAGADATLLQSRCESCGACVAYCPTGALDNKMSISLGRAEKTVPTTCSYCSVGCQFRLNVKNDLPGSRVIRVTSNPAAPVNGMHLCVKGRYGYDFIRRSDRLTRPRVRKYLLDGKRRHNDRGEWVEVDWKTAFNIVADHFVAVRNQDGPERIGIITSGRLLNEENYLVNKLARQVLGTNNIDCGTHLHTSSTVAGLDISTGLSAMTTSLEEIANLTSSILVIGSDLTENHPVLGAKIRQAVLRRGVKVVVANPVFTNLDEYAALSLRYQPGTETALLNGLMYLILEQGWEDRAFIRGFTEGFEEFREVVSLYPPREVAQISGLPIEILCQTAEILATNRPMALIWGTGVTHRDRGPGNIMALSNLQLLLGNVDLPGGGLAPLRSQNNSQGACDMGCLPMIYPGYQRVTDGVVRKKFELAWGVELPRQVGMSAGEMLSAAGDGAIKALYVLGDELISADSDLPIRRYLEAAQFVVNQVVFPTQTSFYADVLLPGVSFAEKTGTFTNTERRVQMVHQAIEPVGSSRPDWQILSELASRILLDVGRPVEEYAYASWDYSNTSQIMEEIAALTPIYAGISHKRLECGDCLMWPVESPYSPGTAKLLHEHFHSGGGKFVPVQYLSSGELSAVKPFETQNAIRRMDKSRR